MRIVALALLVPLFAGCMTEPIAEAATDNPNIRAELLFTNDGCRIFRFRDGATPVYYADCRAAPMAASASTAWRVGCGRNCTRPVMMTTAER